MAIDLEDCRALQRRGRLLAPPYETAETLRRLKELQQPCRTLRERYMSLPFSKDWEVLVDDACYPLVDIFAENDPGYNGNSPLFVLRLRACLLSETFLAVLDSCKKTLDWYREACGYDSIANSPKQDTYWCLPELKKVCVQWNEHCEPYPSQLASSDNLPSRYLSFEAFFENHDVATMWQNTMTPHTSLVIFVEDLRQGGAVPSRHYLFPAYTTPMPPAVEQTISSTQEGKQKTPSQQSAERGIYGRIGEVGYEITAEGERILCDRSTRNFFREVWQHEDWKKKKNKEQKSFAIRLGKIHSLFQAEAGLLALDNLEQDKRDALLRPGSAVLNTAFETCMDDQLFEHVSGFTQSLCATPLSPQQIRFIVRFIVFLVLVLQPQAQFRFLPLGGPPGTGKSWTIAQAILISRNRAAVEGILDALVQWHCLETCDVSALAIEVSTCRLAYAAPTNDAVDSGVETTLEVLKQSGSVFQQLDFQPLRVSALSKAVEKGKHLGQHIDAAVAGKLQEACAVDIARHQAKSERHRVAKEKREQDIESSASRIRSECNAASPSKPCSGCPDCEAKISEVVSEYDELFPTSESDRYTPQDKASYQDSLKRSSRINKFMKGLSNESLTPKEAQKLSKGMSLGDEELRLQVMTEPARVCYLTAGIVNPYHQDIRSALTGSVIILDEATQCQYADLFSLVDRARGVVLCGDKHQLGCVLKSRADSVLDAKRNIMQILSSETLWLTLCYRLHPVLTDFAHQRVYLESGLFYPTGQHVRRFSLHSTSKLFQPCIVLDVEDSTPFSMPGSDSKSSEQEVDVALAWLSVFESIRRAYGIPPLRIRIISPYLAQVKLLKRKLARMAAFADASFVEVGTVETVQGATVDVCICTAAVEGNATFFNSQRMNVAVTRARLHTVFICNRAAITSGQNNLLRHFLTHFEPNTFQIDSRQALPTLRTLAMQDGILPTEALQLTMCNAPSGSVPFWELKGEAPYALAGLLSDGSLRLQHFERQQPERRAEDAGGADEVMGEEGRACKTVARNDDEEAVQEGPVEGIDNDMLDEDEQAYREEFA